ncbi:MAG: hypothetical protein CML04_01820 [Pseudozobellia sp.]|nr:hypothetical protein [Pseudozobellia sp.]MBG48919.1 hypothetical protein [Pseudozobellia sp.]|tara:strand:+ start:1945 stop:2841 length:897 start_codon:yes stop_codon:yes gene_type:complete
MDKIRRFHEIDDYIGILNLRLKSKIPNFFIFDYERVDWEKYNVLSKYKHDYFEISLDITEGCDISVDQYELPSVKNRFVLVGPNRLQTIKKDLPLKKFYRGYGIFFKAEFMQINAFQCNFLKDFPFFSKFGSPSITLSKNDVQIFTDIIKKIIYEHEAGGTFSEHIIRNYLNILLLKANQKYSKTVYKAVDLNRQQEIYDEFRYLVQLYFLELKSVREYAEKIHVTPKHLSETVKKISGESALEIIHKTQINYAKALLCQTHKTISEIAFELNFENPEYFSVFFKRLSGKTPSDYRIS